MNIKQAIEAFKAYMSSTDNPAEVTSAQLDMYSREELNNILNGYLPTGSFGVSKYGDNNWTPPNVLGSFEGGQRNENRAYIPMLQEPNGSFCLLENATNGAKSGTYLTFLEPNADGKSLTLNATPRRYEPPILQKYPGNRVFEVYCSEGKDVVWGKIINESTAAVQNFIALTGGTMDATGHICTLMNLWTGAEQQTRAVLVKNRVYFIQMTSPPLIRIFYVNVSDIVAGNTVTPTELTSWTTTGLNGTVRSNTSIQYAASINSTDASADSMFWLDTNITANNVSGVRHWSATHPTDNKLRMVFQGSFISYWTGNSGYSNGITIVMDIDFDALTVTVLPESRIKAKIQNSDSGGVQDSVSLAFTTKYIKPVIQLHDQMVITDQGKFLEVHYSNEGLGWYRYGSMGKGVETTAFDKLHPNNFNASSITGTVQLFRRFGSLVGGNSFVRTSYPNGAMHIYTTTTTQEGASVPLGANVYVESDTAYNGFTYKTDYGDIKGYRPTTKRTRLTTVEGTPIQTMLCTGTNHKITKVGCAPVTPDRPSLSAPLEVSFDGSSIVNAGKGVYTIAAAALDAIKNAAKASYGSNFTTLTGLEINAELWIPPAGVRTYPPIVSLMMWSPTDLKAFWVWYQVTVTFSSGNLTSGGTISNVAAAQVLLTNAQANIIAHNFNDKTAGFVYEHFNASGTHVYTALYVPSALNNSVPGGSSGLRLELAINPGDANYSTTYARYQQSSTWYFGYSPLFLVDGVGPVIMDFTRIREQGGAGLYYRKIQQDSLAEYWARNLNTADQAYYIWVSSQVAEGYEVYFTDDDDSLIDGEYYLVKAVTKDLRDVVADPSNKTFYVWLALTNGVVSYVITANQSDVYDLYIGKIVTGATQIDSINIVKATVFNW
jgi:hypothetical protein